MTSSNDDIIKAILQYQERLERYSLSKSDDKMLYVLGKLSKLHIRTLHLENTGVGRTVNSLKKLGGTVGEAAKDLVALWKVMVLEEERATQDTSLENDDDADSVYSSENENKDCQKENLHHSENESEGYDSKQEVPRKRNDFENNSHNLKNGDGSRNNPKSNSSSSSSSSSSESEEEMPRKQKKHHSRKRSHSSHSSSEERETHSKKSKKDRDNSSKVRHKYKSSEENRNSEHEKSDKVSSNRYKENSEKHKESSVKYKKNTDRSDSTHKSRKDSENESKQKSKKEFDEDKKHKNKKDSENLRSSNKTEKNKNRENHEKKELHDSNSNHKSEKHKKQNEKADKDMKSSHTSKHKDKSLSHSSVDKSSSKKHDKKHESKRDRKESHSETLSKDSTKEYKKTNSSKAKASESSSSSKHKSSSSDSHVKKKHKSDKVSNTDKQKIVHGIDSESGASFAEALGMCGPLTSNPKKKPSSDKLKSSQNSSRHLDNVETESSKGQKSKYNDSECSSSTKLVVPELLKEEPAEPLNICLSSLLPEITPNYKPLGISYDSQPKRSYTDEEALSRVMTNKNQRTKVYSGNKTVGKVESLFQLCVRILQDNIDALEYTGGVPYIILKPIMERATADQIFNLEHHNPYLIEDTDELWQLHCQKDFRTKQRQEMESWRDMYMRCLDEREAKLNAVKANIKLSQDKSIPVRTTKLAYVDSEFVKPPRNVARKQFKNGTVVTDRKISTSQKLTQLAQSGEASKVSVPDPGKRATDRSGGSGTVSSSAAMKPKKAPLMAKTLSFLKNRFKR